MSGSLENPYATPLADPEELPAEGSQWQVVDGLLLVRDGAELPEIDLLGSSGDRLSRITRTVGGQTIWQGGAGVGIVLANLLVHRLNLKGPEQLAWIAGITLTVAAVFIALHRMTRRTARISYTVGRTRQFGLRCGSGLASLTIFGAMSWTFWALSAAGSLSEGSFPAAMGAIFGGVLLNYTCNAFRIICRKELDGWFYLRLPRERTILALAALQAERARSSLVIRPPDEPS